MRALWIAVLALASAACERAADGPVITVPTMTAPEPSVTPSPRGPVASRIREGEHFQLAFEQFGKEEAIRDEQVDLFHDHFVLVVRFAKPGAIMLNVSVSAKWFLLAGTGHNRADLEEVMGPGHGMAENDPPERELVASDESAHYLHYESEGAHRCHEVRRGSDDVIECRRFVDKIGFVGSSTNVLAPGGAAAIYIVAVMNDPARPGAELQRARLKIVLH